MQWIIETVIVILIWVGVVGGMVGWQDYKSDIGGRIFSVAFMLFCFGLAIFFFYMQMGGYFG